MEGQRASESSVLRTLASRNPTIARYCRPLAFRHNRNRSDRYQCVEGVATRLGLADGCEQRIGLRQRNSWYWKTGLPHRTRTTHSQHHRTSESSGSGLTWHRHGTKALRHRWLPRRRITCILWRHIGHDTRRPPISALDAQQTFNDEGERIKVSQTSGCKSRRHLG